MWCLWWQWNVLQRSFCYISTSWSNLRCVVELCTSDSVLKNGDFPFRISRSCSFTCRICTGKRDGDQSVLQLPRYKLGCLGIGRRSCRFDCDPYRAVVRNGLDSSRYYVNGNWKISQPGIYSAAGATIFYRRVPESFETMLINGPLKEPLVIMVRQLQVKPIRSVQSGSSIIY